VRHTYDTNIYLPYIDRFLVLGGSAWNKGGSYLYQYAPGLSRRTGPYTFDLTKADGDKVGGTTGSHVQRINPYPEILGGMMWQNRDLYGFMPESSLPVNFTTGTTAYVSSSNGDELLFSAQSGGTAQALYRYRLTDPDDAYTDTVEQVGRYAGGASAGGAGAYDPHKNLFVRTAKNRSTGLGDFYYWNLATAGPTNPNIVFVPADLSGGWALDREYGLDYDPVRRKYLMWGGEQQVWALTAPTSVSASGWTIEKVKSVAPSGAPAYFQVSSDVGGRVLGKWKYIPELDAFMALEDPVAGNVWLYKPEGWRRPGQPDLPVIGLSAQPAVVAPGGAVQLTWNVTNASSCQAEGGWSGNKMLSGSQAFGPLSATTEFGLRCTGAGGEAVRTISVLVELSAPAILSFSAGSCVNSAQLAEGAVVSGTAVPGTTVFVSFGGLSRSASVTGAGTWSVAYDSSAVLALPDGAIAVTARVQDSSGNVSPTTSISVTKDTIAPTATSTTPDLEAASDTGASSTDNVTRDNTPTFVGAAGSGSRVVLLVNGTVAATVTAGSNGVWRATTAKLVDGAYTVRAAVTDSCGNQGQRQVRCR
jgi:hypothetical protein